MISSICCFVKEEIRIVVTRSARPPQEDSCRVEVEVEAVIFFKAKVASEVLADNALPSGEESFIEELLQLLSEIYILELGRSRRFLLNEFNCFNLHIYSLNE